MRAQRRYLVSTLGLLAVAAAYFIVQGAPPRPGPRLERPPRPVTAPAPRTLTARGILDRRVELGLTASQVARLEALERQWSERNHELDAAVTAAQEEVSRYLQTHAGGQASLSELERQSVDLRELSAELRQRRRLHAEAAMELLTEPQRRQVLPAHVTRDALGEGS